jgi:hypothetical protein
MNILAMSFYYAKNQRKKWKRISTTAPQICALKI